MKKAIAPLILVCLQAATACTSSSAYVNRFPNVVVYGEYVEITDVTDQRRESDLLHVVVFGRSVSDYDRAVRYRALWVDSEGRPINTVVSAWKETSMPGLRPFNMEFVAPGERAKGYLVEIEILGRY